MAIDPALQAQVDAQLLEQGAFAVLEFLTDSGRLATGDYEGWRRREIDTLDDVLMGSKEKIKAQIEAVAGYARGIGLVEELQTFHPWGIQGGDAGTRALRVSGDPQLNRLIASRFVPAQSAPQMDLFFDNPVVALTSGITRALSAGNLAETKRLVDRLYAQAPNHADLAAFDRLASALGHLHQPVADPRRELAFLSDITATAKRLMGSQARDLLAPLWRQLAGALGTRSYSSEEPDLHRSFALAQSQDWAEVCAAVRQEPRWYLHAPLCLRLAQGAFYQRARVEALAAWCHLCWRFPAQAAAALDDHRQADAGVAALWRAFVDGEEDPALETVDFPAWLLLREPGLARQLPADLPAGDSAGEEHYRIVHRWILARRTQRQAEEMALRKTLQAGNPALFQCLKRCVS